ncbi:MAG: hypothetical protein E6J81_01295 [Deltaproteobacteria bacterium]|nr:MAG: hypothetical protein E6J81_01295 [Deltaproteobacteria bacterium]
MRSSLGRLVLGLAVLGAGSAAHAYYLDQSRNFDVRLRTYSQVAIATESSRESPPTFSPGDLFSQRNFYNPEFDANLTNYVGWTRKAPGFSLIAPDEFKFHFGWWGFYDGMFDYLSPQWRDALRAVPRSRQSSSDDIDGETTRFNDENKNPRNILGKRNRINELYLDFSKGRLFTRIGRQSIAWGEADAIVFMDVINNFDLTMGVPGIFMDLEEARIPFWAIRNTIRLVDQWGPLSSLFADMYMVPGPIDTTVPLTTPAFFGFPYSQPGQDPLRNPALAPLIKPLPLEVVLVDRLPKNEWSETRWGARLTSVLFRDYTVQGWFFRTYPTAPVPLLIGGTPPITLATTQPQGNTLIDDRGFRTPVCLDNAGNPIPNPGSGHTPAGRACKYARPVITAFYRRLTSVAGAAATWYSPEVAGIIRTEAEYFIKQDAFIPSVNLNPQVQVPTPGNKINTIPKADYLKYMIGYDRFFFARWINPANSIALITALNGQWNVTARREKDFRFNGIAKPGKNQIEAGRIPGNPACQTPPFSILCLTAPAKNFEDEKKFEHFFNIVFQTDYMHGRLEPRIIMLFDVSSEFIFEPSATYRLTDYLLATGTFAAIEGSRKAGPAVFRDRDQFQFRMTYLLN